jgi:hypothetical protein
MHRSPMKINAKAGEIWQYPYLWAWQDARGETEGRKHRPCAVAIEFAKRDGLTAAFLLAITSKEPTSDRTAIEIPEIERHRAKLSSQSRLWVILDEYNTDIIEKSFYFEPDAYMGKFSDRFIRQIQRSFARFIRTGETKSVPRI